MDRIRGDLHIKKQRLGKRCLVLAWDSEEKYIEGVIAMNMWHGSTAFYLPSYSRRPHMICFYRDEELFSQVLPHELTHLILKIALDPSGKCPIPLWLNEGLAECETTRPFNEVARDILKAKKKREYIPLRELVLFQNYPEDFDRCHLFYLEAAGLVRFLLERETYPGEFFELAKRLVFWGGDFISIFKKTYSRKYPDFTVLENSFEQFIEENAGSGKK